MNTAEINRTAVLTRISLLLALLSQILEPVYSDRNFLALAKGSVGGDLYDFLIFYCHSAFADLGLLYLQIVLMLAISVMFFLNLNSVNKNQSSFVFLVYLMAIISIFYARDVSPDHFYILLLLIASSVARGRRIKLVILNIFSIYLLLSQRTYFNFDSTPLGYDIYNAIYPLSVGFLLLVLSTLLISRNRKRLLQVLVLITLYSASFFSPSLRMVFPIYSSLFIVSYMEDSKGLSNISSIISRFVDSMSFLSGYALIFFLIAFSFSQAGPCFKVPLHTTFMPAERVDKLIEKGGCLGEAGGFTKEERSKFEGYLMYRSVYSELRYCDY